MGIFRKKTGDNPKARTSLEIAFYVLFALFIIIGAAVLIHNSVTGSVSFCISVLASGEYSDEERLMDAHLLLSGTWEELNGLKKTVRTSLMNSGLSSSQITADPVLSSEDGSCSLVIKASLLSDEQYTALMDYSQGLENLESVTSRCVSPDMDRALNMAFADAYSSLLKRVASLKDVFPSVRESEIITIREKNVSFNPENGTAFVTLEGTVEVTGQN